MSDPTLESWGRLLAWLAIVYFQIGTASSRDTSALWGRVRSWATRGHPTACSASVLIPWAGAGWALVPSSHPPIVACKLPPAALFGVAWSVLYGIMAVTLWSATECASLSSGQRAYLISAALVHLLLNKLWTPIFWSGARAAARVHDAEHMKQHMKQRMTLIGGGKGSGARGQRSPFESDVGGGGGGSSADGDDDGTEALSGLPPDEWVKIKRASRGTETSASYLMVPALYGMYGRALIVTSLVVILGNLVSSIVVTESLGRNDFTVEMWLWLAYCAWLLYAAYLNAVACVYYW
jgi:tryptophan-rich sensory protein